MIQVTGDIEMLLELAVVTNTLTELKQKLGYLNRWGNEHKSEVQVEMLIYSVNIERRDAEVGLTFYKSEPGRAFGAVGHHKMMNGGLNLSLIADEKVLSTGESVPATYSWSINT